MEKSQKYSPNGGGLMVIYRGIESVKNNQLNKQKTSTVSPTITLNKQKYIIILDPSWLMK